MHYKAWMIVLTPVYFVEDRESGCTGYHDPE